MLGENIRNIIPEKEVDPITMYSVLLYAIGRITCLFAVAAVDIVN